MEGIKVIAVEAEILTARQYRYKLNKAKEQRVARAYYQAHKATINAKNRCECGGVFTINNISNHKKTQRHCDYVTQTGIFQYPVYIRKQTA